MACRHVSVHPVLEDYLLDLTEATRLDENIQLGASPRASLALYRTSQALAAVRGRTHVIPDDIKALAMSVLAHRLRLNADAQLRSQTIDQVLTALIERVPVPVEEVWTDPELA
jgi:MoxR-like ATPase